MKSIVGITITLAAMATIISSAQAAINIKQAKIENGQVIIAGKQAPKRAAISWEGVMLGISSDKDGEFKFATDDLPPACVGRLRIGTEERDVVIINCTPANITVIEAGIPKTGQTTSFAPGDDGDLEKGVSTTPDPRFTDNGDGTIKDNLTGLIWLKNANCFGPLDWLNALATASGLAHGACGLIDGSLAGNWRVPNVRELHSLVDLGQTVSPLIPSGHPFVNFARTDYFSSTTFAVFSANALYVDFTNGLMGAPNKLSQRNVTFVRDGW